MYSTQLEKNNTRNEYEINFIINVSNGRTLGFCGDQEVKYAYTVSGSEAFTFRVRPSGGRDSRIEAPFMVFIKMDSHYPIRNEPDDVNVVWYRPRPKRWIDKYYCHNGFWRN